MLFEVLIDGHEKQRSAYKQRSKSRQPTGMPKNQFGF
jgi:hypothetical protein